MSLHVHVCATCMEPVRFPLVYCDSACADADEAAFDEYDTTEALVCAACLCELRKCTCPPVSA